jgi:hypothetical protein
MSLSTPTATITPTDTATPGTPTINPQVLYAYSTLAASGQPVAIVYTATAGEIGIAAINLAMLLVLLFMAFLLMVRSRNANQ